MAETKAYEEIIDFIAAGSTPEAVVAFRPSPEAQQRIQELIERRQNGVLPPDEENELEEFLQLEHLLIMAKARARRHLEK